MSTGYTSKTRVGSISTVVVIGVTAILIFLAAGLSVLLDSAWPIVGAGILSVTLLFAWIVQKSSPQRRRVITVSTRYNTQIDLRGRLEELEPEEWVKILENAVTWFVLGVLVLLIVVPRIRSMPVSELERVVLFLGIVLTLGIVVFVLGQLYQRMIDRSVGLQNLRELAREWSLGTLLLGTTVIGVSLWWYYSRELVERVGSLPFLPQLAPFANYQPEIGPALVLVLLLGIAGWNQLRARDKHAQKLRDSAITTALFIVIVVGFSVFGTSFVLPLIVFLAVFILVFSAITGFRVLLEVPGVVAKYVKLAISALLLLPKLVFQLGKAITAFIGRLLENLDFLTIVLRWMIGLAGLIAELGIARIKYLDAWLDAQNEPDKSKKLDLVSQAQVECRQLSDEARNKFRGKIDRG